MLSVDGNPNAQLVTIHIDDGSDLALRMPLISTDSKFRPVLIRLASKLIYAY
jgi:hypothetical protein